MDLQITSTLVVYKMICNVLLNAILKISLCIKIPVEKHISFHFVSSHGLTVAVTCLDLF